MPDAMAQGLRMMIDAGFNEDKVMLNAIQASADADTLGRDGLELSFVGDSVGLMVQRVLQTLLDRERAAGV